jgi:hypothetical protein
MSAQKLRALYEAKEVKSIKFGLSSIIRDYVEVYSLAERMIQHRMVTNHPLLAKYDHYYLIVGIARCSKLRILAKDNKSNPVSIDIVDTLTSNLQFVLSIEKSGSDENVFKGNKSLAFGVEIYEMTADFKSGKLRFQTTDNHLVIDQSSSDMRPRSKKGARNEKKSKKTKRGT